MFLPRIQSKDVEFEEKHSQEYFHELDRTQLPPCVAEKINFMSPHPIIKVANHPYTEFEDLYKHYDKTPLKYPGYSFSVVPFGWMLKARKTKESAKAKEYNVDYAIDKEPQLTFNDNWVQNHENQKALLDTFISAIRVDKSLVFIYAKNIPLIDNIDRILIGVGRVTKVGGLREYKYKNDTPTTRSYLWERPVYHSIRDGFKEGFILPYHDVIDKIESDSSLNPEDYIAFAPNFEEFSYGAEIVTHDSAIEALLSLRKALYNSGRLLDKHYDNQIDWINNEISKIWNMRGAFPGLGSVLSAIKIPNGNLIELLPKNWTRQ